jgi:hypothetical protein
MHFYLENPKQPPYFYKDYYISFLILRLKYDTPELLVFKNADVFAGIIGFDIH